MLDIMSISRNPKGSIILEGQDSKALEKHVLNHISAIYQIEAYSIHSISHPDIFTINPLLQNSIKIEDMREAQSRLSYKPYNSEIVTIIINNAHKMTTEAQNSFLKTLEEPPEFASIILLTNSSEGLLDTVVSRCRIYKIQDNKNSEDSENADLTRLLQSDLIGSFKLAEEIAKDKASKMRSNNLIDSLELYFYKLMNKKLGKNQEFTREKELLIKIRNARYMISRNTNTRVVLENLFLDILEI